jgi:hypothetical protein
MKKLLISLAALSLVAGGCASSGLTASSHVTNVQLNTTNFRVVATNVVGQSSASAVLGVSFGVGIGTAQLALIPITEDRMLYKQSISDLWANFEKTNGPVVGRRLALVNVRYDSESLNLILYTKITSVIVADVVEFQ